MRGEIVEEWRVSLAANEREREGGKDGGVKRV